ncbi:hypothetical protein BT96DRAFT_843082 [Gymnopus androsaceus JB14]|uniref:Integrase core domain-containing protein n=1 Tax=Gymnopus androsaceus JB14 TaxID=1447944 RepID=A0A6A4GES8_9AGAR|nr:hypothetical protein BT96DRAFT_843082 [Gymnopus androsaceus JB14]
MAHSGRDQTHYFLAEAHNLTSRAKFIIQSLPNAEVGAVESMVHKLYTIRTIVRSLDDPHSTPEELESSHNVRIERLWRDIRKDTLEAFRKIFEYLEREGLLDMTNLIQRLVLFVVFQPRIQASLHRSADAWNHHQVRTAGNKMPIALYEISCEHAKTHGYWTGDPGDDIHTASHSMYGLEDELDSRGTPGDHSVPEEDDNTNIRVNEDEDLVFVRNAFREMEFDLEKDDGNWGIEVYCEAVLRFQAFVQAQSNS